MAPAPAFLARYPAPADARRLSERQLGRFCERHGYPGRRTPAELLARLAGAPAGRVGEAEAEADRGIVLGLVAALRPSSSGPP